GGHSGRLPANPATRARLSVDRQDPGVAGGLRPDLQAVRQVVEGVVIRMVRAIGALGLTLLLATATLAADKPRLLVLTDIGGDPDDQQSLIRLVVHANEFDIDGLIASASGVPGELKQDVVKPELIREIVEAYGKVQPNLVKHHPDFPDAR